MAALQTTGSKYGIIACHDGTVYRYELVDGRYANYNYGDWQALSLSIGRGYEKRIVSGKSEADALAALENEWGVRIEHLR